MSERVPSRARIALARGDVLVAYDEAVQATEVDPGDLDARYVAALALARAGATERARSAAEALVASLAAAGGGAASPALREDAEALVARIAKDEALAASPRDRPALLVEAASRYEHVASRYGGYYAPINAATLFLLAGEDDRSRRLAATARREAATAAADSPDAYWACATEAEAALILDDLASAREAIARATALSVTDLAARAATRRQLRLVCAARDIDPSLLDPFAPPGVMHYCGHRRTGDATQEFPESVQELVRAELRSYLDHQPIGFAYGSLASGADIVVAEVLLETDIQLNVVLPFAVDEFVATSVESAGEEWIDRFSSCLERATAVTVASDSAYGQFDDLFGYAGCVAMGQALNYASFLAAPAVQLAVWDGVASDGAAGTAHDVRTWRLTGNETHVIAVPPTASGRSAEAEGGRSPREIRAVLFSDFRGFSRLRDEQFPAFLDHALGRLAAVLAEHRPNVLWSNTVGDGIAAVCADVVTAASCALEFHRSLASVDLATFGLPSDLTLRIGVHVGPVIAMRDPVRDEMAYWGREMTRAARIEPRTPEGEVYVTEAVAALLALEKGVPFVSEYVGRVTTAKDFETIPMYRLRRREPVT